MEITTYPKYQRLLAELKVNEDLPNMVAHLRSSIENSVAIIENTQNGNLIIKNLGEQERILIKGTKAITRLLGLDFRWENSILNYIISGQLEAPKGAPVTFIIEYDKLAERYYTHYDKDKISTDIPENLHIVEQGRKKQPTRTAINIRECDLFMLKLSNRGKRDYEIYKELGKKFNIDMSLSTIRSRLSEIRKATNLDKNLMAGFYEKFPAKPKI